LKKILIFKVKNVKKKALLISLSSFLVNLFCPLLVKVSGRTTRALYAGGIPKRAARSSIKISNTNEWKKNFSWNFSSLFFSNYEKLISVDIYF